MSNEGTEAPARASGGGVASLAVRGEDADIRLDRWFKRHYPGLSHGRLEKLLRTGQVRVDGRRASASDRIQEGQTIRVPPLGDFGSLDGRQRRQTELEPSAEDAKTLQAAVLYRDDRSEERRVG